jgi:hypothetical protein
VLQTGAVCVSQCVGVPTCALLLVGVCCMLGSMCVLHLQPIFGCEVFLHTPVCVHVLRQVLHPGCSAVSAVAAVSVVSAVSAVSCIIIGVYSNNPLVSFECVTQ